MNGREKTSKGMAEWIHGPDDVTEGGREHGRGKSGQRHVRVPKEQLIGAKLSFNCDCCFTSCFNFFSSFQKVDRRVSVFTGIGSGLSEQQRNVGS
jgi:hypothetical protein